MSDVIVMVDGNKFEGTLQEAYAFIKTMAEFETALIDYKNNYEANKCLT